MEANEYPPQALSPIERYEGLYQGESPERKRRHLKTDQSAFRLFMEIPEHLAQMKYGLLQLIINKAYLECERQKRMDEAQNALIPVPQDRTKESRIQAMTKKAIGRLMHFFRNRTKIESIAKKKEYEELFFLKLRVFSFDGWRKLERIDSILYSRMAPIKPDESPEVLDRLQDLYFSLQNQPVIKEFIAP